VLDRRFIDRVVLRTGRSIYLLANLLKFPSSAIPKPCLGVDFQGFGYDIPYMRGELQREVGELRLQIMYIVRSGVHSLLGYRGTAFLRRAIIESC